MATSKEEKAFLANYNIHDYDVPLASVDVVVFTIINEQVNVLINRRASFPEKNKWAIPGGFVDCKHDKDIEQTARRKLKEKTGYDAPFLEQLASIGNANRDPRGWSITITYFALVNHENVVFSDDCKWCSLDNDGSANEELAFDHNELVQDAFQRLRNKSQYTSIVLHVLPEKFTLSELQQAYEIILGGKLNKAGFRRRILKAEVIKELEGEFKQTATRTAQLYSKLNGDEVHFYMREIYAK